MLYAGPNTVQPLFAYKCREWKCQCALQRTNPEFGARGKVFAWPWGATLRDFSRETGKFWKLCRHTNERNGRVKKSAGGNCSARGRGGGYLCIFHSCCTSRQSGRRELVSGPVADFFSADRPMPTGLTGLYFPVLSLVLCYEVLCCRGRVELYNVMVNWREAFATPQNRHLFGAGRRKL